MKVVKTYVMPLMLVGGLLLNSVPTHAFFAYGVGIELDYSVTLNSKKDIRNFLLIACGLTLLGFGAYYFSKWIERSNNRPSAPAAIISGDDLEEMRQHRTRCINSYVFDGIYRDLNEIFKQQTPGQELEKLSQEAQKKHADGMNEVTLQWLAEKHFNVRNSRVNDYQKKLTDDIAKLNHNMARVRQMQGAIPAGLVEDFSHENKYAIELKPKLEAVQNFMNSRARYFQTYQQRNSIHQQIAR